ncbi:hypothetical protein ACS0TY_022344 [Phlomoides rotata]
MLESLIHRSYHYQAIIDHRLYHQLKVSTKHFIYGTGEVRQLEGTWKRFGELILGQSTSGKSGSVLPKKRRHLLQSPPTHPQATPLCGQDSASKRTGSSSPFSEDHDLFQYRSCSLGQRSSNWNKRRVQGSAKVGGGFQFGDVSLFKQTVSGYIDTGDFSGIELLAAAASMDADADKANEKDHQEDSSMPNNSDSSSSATLSNVGLKNNESENSSSNANVHGGDMDCSQEKMTSKDPFILGCRDNSGWEIVHFIVCMSSEQLLDAKAEELQKKFKLTISIAATNMHLFDPNGVVKKYDTPEQILEEFFDLRLEFYD